MRAVDTNVLARYYLRDDPAQARLAERALSAGDLFVPKTVVLEPEWGLRHEDKFEKGSCANDSALRPVNFVAIAAR